MTARAGSRARTAARWRCTRWPGSPSSRSCRRPTSSRCPKRLSLRARRCSAAPSFTAYGAVKHAGACRSGPCRGLSRPAASASTSWRWPGRSGARQVIAVDVALDKLEAARALGASDVVDSSAVDAVAAVRELTAGRGRGHRLRSARTAGHRRPGVSAWCATAARWCAWESAPGAAAAEIEITQPGAARDPPDRVLRRAPRERTCRA